MTKRILHKTLCVLGALFLSLLFVFQTVSFSARADENSVQDFRKTSIMDDLSDIEIALYPKQSKGKPQVIRCQEYCYSEKPFFAEYYALIIYVYNPTETPLNVQARNIINMAVEYGTDGKPSAWSNVELTYLHKTENNRFYKFEVSNWQMLLTMSMNYAQAHDGERRYDFADIQFTSTDGKKISSSAFSKTYYFNGYGAGCGATSSSESTLTCHVEGAETVELNVQHTNYRTGMYDDNDVCDELNTAYFSVGNDYFEKYGSLQKIKADWYEYKTKPIFVTSDEEGYDYLDDYIGKDISNEDLDWHVFWDFMIADDAKSLFKYGYANKNTGINWAVASFITRMDWLFKRSDVESRDDWYVTQDEVTEYMEWYTNKFAGTTVNGYGANLFTDTVDEGRTRGYNEVTIDAGEEHNLAVYDKNQSWWNKLWHGTKFEDLGYSPIVAFTKNDLNAVKGLSADEFGATYLVNKDDQEDVRNYVITELEKGNRPVLFRFAQTDYYASTACFDKVGLFLTSEDGFVAQMTQFHDFDIISLTFRSEKGEDTVIGVCATPIDIINGVEPPSDLGGEDTDWWFWLVLLGVGVVAVFAVAILWPIIWPIIVGCARLAIKLLVKILMWVGKIIWFIWLFPFNLIIKLFKRKDKSPNEDNHEE